MLKHSNLRFKILDLQSQNDKNRAMCTFFVKKYTFVCVFFCTFAADL